MTRIKGWLILLITAVMAVGLFGCEREGPAERAGERVDETVERAGDRVERATDN